MSSHGYGLLRPFPHKIFSQAAIDLNLNCFSIMPTCYHNSKDGPTSNQHPRILLMRLGNSPQDFQSPLVPWLMKVSEVLCPQPRLSLRYRKVMYVQRTLRCFNVSRHQSSRASCIVIVKIIRRALLGTLLLLI